MNCLSFRARIGSRNNWLRGRDHVSATFLFGRQRVGRNARRPLALGDLVQVFKHGLLGLRVVAIRYAVNVSLVLRAGFDVFAIRLKVFIIVLRRTIITRRWDVSTLSTEIQIHLLLRLRVELRLRARLAG